MTPSFLLNELSQAQTQTDACLFCWLEAHQVTRYLTGVANDGVNNIPLREKLAARGGYCAAHCAEFAEIASPLSAAILLEAFIKARLARSAAGKRPLELRCEACEVGQTTRQTFVKNVRRHRDNADLQKILVSAELCLEHLELHCKHLPDALRRDLVSEHEALQRNLAELIRKHDYRFTHETISDEEKRSISAALRLLGGAS